MSKPDPKIAELEARLERLVRTQIDFQKEVSLIRGELIRLRSAADRAERSKPEPSLYNWQKDEPEAKEPPKSVVPDAPEPRREVSPPGFGMRSYASEQYSGSAAADNSDPAESGFSRYASDYSENARANLEKFIGENLISKIGIIVLIIGVGIGVKYSIDNDLISPLARVIVGYVFGFGLVGFAIKLKGKYHNFSAALLSGGMAIMYFVTYFAYSAYSLIPQSSTFALMALFTVFTVLAALVYNRQVIAHIGLVGAFAVPFLLSTGAANYAFLFAYMALINAGILAISLKRDWSAIFYTSSGLTWLIYFGWFVNRYSASDHFYLALIFLGIFFSTFFATRIAHSVNRDAADESENVISTLLTALIFYGFLFGISKSTIGTSQLWTLFAYLAGFTAAILAVSLRLYGRELLYLCFAGAWLIFGAWFADNFDPARHVTVAAVFSSTLFAIFYAGILVHRLRTEGLVLIESTGLVLTNSFLFYGFGYSVIDSLEGGENYLGLYTVAHAALHYGVAAAIGRARAEAVDVVQALSILVLTFASIAIPVQFDGNAVTMIWAVEAALLFWFGRAKGIPLYEFYSLPVMALAAGSLVLDWAVAISDRTLEVSELNRQPLANGDLVTALVFVAAFAFVFITNRNSSYRPAIPAEFVRPFGYVVAAVATLALYNAFRMEIGNYYHLQAVAAVGIGGDGYPNALADTERLNVAWQINYTIGFLIALIAANIKRFRSVPLVTATAGPAALVLMVFATAGMVVFYELRESYLAAGGGPWINIAIRYISYAFVAGLLYVLHLYTRDDELTGSLPRSARLLAFEGVLFSLIFIAASCELVNLMAQFHIADGTKLGLSILWGAYALFLIVLGIAKQKKHLRIAAFALLGVTLLKLFFYDIADLDTIPKTILFVTLGITLLLISFLYNKYKNAIFGGIGDPEDNVEES